MKAIRLLLKHFLSWLNASATSRSFTGRHISSDVLLRLINEHIPEIVTIINAQGKVIYHNDALRVILGYATQDITGGNANDARIIMHPEDHAWVIGAIEQAIINRQSLRTEYRVRHQHGHFVWLETTLNFQFDERGQLLYQIFISRDVTERKQAEETLAKERHLLRSLIDAMPFHIYARDSQRRFIVNNRYNQRAFGVDSQEEILGKTDEDFAPNKLARLYVEDDERVIKRGETVLNRLERSLSDAREPIWGMATKAPLYDDNGKIIGLVGSTIDVTEAINTREALMQSQLKEISLVETLDKERETAELKKLFTSMLSHEFRTPLTTIVASVDVMERYSDRLDDQQRAERFETIRQETALLTDMLNDMLVIMQMQDNVLRFEPMPQDMSALLEKIVGQVRNSIGTQHQIELVMPSELPLVELDERIFRYMILNLLTNALKYSSPGSKVAVQVSLTTQGVQVTVQDAGIGIPNADMPRLFEPFRRGQNVRAIGGTGLGLKIVKDCVEMHHGSVQIDSTENVGTTVTVTLPTRANQYPTPPPP